MYSRICFQLILCILIPISLFAQPANDNCNSAIEINNLDGSCRTFNNTGATFDLANGSCATLGPAGNNVWFQFTAQGPDVNIRVNMSGAVEEITLVQFNGTPCTFSAAEELGCAYTILDASGLIAGQPYYVIVTFSNNAEGSFNICIDNPPAPPPPGNDTPCGASCPPLNVNCVSGTTLGATSDFLNPGCPLLSENTVWYQFSTTGNNNIINVNLANINISGDASFFLVTFAPDCSGQPTLVGSSFYCGSPNANISFPGLTPGQTYYLAVGTSNADAGDFDLCLTETGPPPGCANNAECSDAEVISVPPGGTTCVTGCNDGATPGPNLGVGGCFDFPGQSVFYEFTPGANVNFVNISLAGLSQPQVAIFQNFGCAGFLALDCNSTTSGSVILSNVSVTPGVQYVIVASDVAGGGGFFDLCVNSFLGGTNCNTDSEVTVTGTSLGSPPTGPFKPGEKVDICLTVNNFNSGLPTNNCQWLQGIVPTFGECWDPQSFNPDGSPAELLTALGPQATSGNWSWYQSGITYNNIPGGKLPPGAVLPPGWFFTNTSGNGPSGSDPNGTWGDGNSCNDNNGTSWTVCFRLTARFYPDCQFDPSYTDCTVSFQTFGDGEIGGWTQAGCQADGTWSNNLSLNCCEGPLMFPYQETVCSGQQTLIGFSSNQDPEVSYSWTVAEPNQYGAVSGSGDFLTQRLINNTGALGFVTYTVTPVSDLGCEGIPVDYTITVLPETDAVIPQPDDICAGECTNLSIVPVAGQPPFSYNWSNGLGTGPFVSACPGLSTTYRVTVTDAIGCTTEESVFVQVNQPLNITIDANPNVPEFCEGDFDEITLSVNTNGIGDQPFIYTWSLPTAPFISYSPVIMATESGRYSVTVTDGNFCFGESAFDLTIHPPSDIAINDPGLICEIDPTASLTAMPSNGTWFGVADASGNIRPDTLGVGLHTAYYEVTDTNGCYALDSLEFFVNPMPAMPTIPNDTILCYGDTTWFSVDSADYVLGYDWIVPVEATIVDSVGSTAIRVAYGDAPDAQICVVARYACGDSPLTCFDVDVYRIPDPPPSLSRDTVCAGESGIVYQIPLSDFATEYNWTLPPGVIISDGINTDSITVDFSLSATSGQICVEAVNQCGVSAASCFDLFVKPVPEAPEVLPNDSLCIGQLGAIYQVAPVLHAESYLWTYPSGITPQGPTDQRGIILDVGLATSGQVCVQAQNDCGVGPSSCFDLSIRDIPATPLIVGPDTVCVGASAVLFELQSLVNQATSYQWQVPAGAVINSGQGSSQISVDFGSNAGGLVEVVAVNECGQSSATTLPVVIKLELENPVLSPSFNACFGASNFSINIPATTGAESYQWTLPAGATILNGAGTASVEIDWGTASSGQVCVEAVNSCGLSDLICSPINITNIPVQPVALVSSTECSGTMYSLAIPAVAEANNYVWQVNAGASIVNGQGSTNVEILLPGNAGNVEVCVLAENQCGQSPQACTMLEVIIAPQAQLLLDDTLCVNETAIYSIPDLYAQSSFNWVLPPQATLLNGLGTNQIEVEWTAAQSGQICVETSNPCGQAQSCFYVGVGGPPASPSPLPDQLLCETSASGSFSILPVVSAESYTWSLPTGATLVNQNNTDIQVDWTGATDGQVCVFASNTCGDGPQMCFDVQFQAQPDPSFTVDSPICLGETATISYQGGAASSATYNWDFDGGLYQSGVISGDFEVSFATPGVYDINLQVEDGVCQSDLETATIEVIAPMAEPIITCQSATDSIIFDWTNVIGATGYQITVLTGQTGYQVGNTFIVNNLAVNENVEIQVEALGTAPCGSSFGTQACISEDCLIRTVDITSVSPICLSNANPIQLQAIVSGPQDGVGEWNGPGITDAALGTFDPSIAGPGNPHTISYQYSVSSCSYFGTIDIQVFDEPDADFNLVNEACLSDIITISLDDPVDPSATYSWDFDGATILSGTGGGPYEVQWNTPGNPTVNLSVEANGCQNTSNAQIALEAPLAAPVISCSNNLSSLNFSWADVSGATGYQVNVISGPNTGSLIGNSYQITGLAEGTFLEIEVIVLGSTLCPVASSTASCITSSCQPIDLSIFPVASICLDQNTGTQLLSVDIIGANGTGTGVWSGTGITDTLQGIFDPQVVGAGTATVFYTYEEDGCTYQTSTTIDMIPQPQAAIMALDDVCLGESQLIEFNGQALPGANFIWDFGDATIVSGSGAGPYEVLFTTSGTKDISLQIEQQGCTSNLLTETIQAYAPLTPPALSCSEQIGQVEFSWAPVVGATGYTVNVLNGPAGSLVGTNYTITGLANNQQVEIEVIAESNGTCPSVSATLACQAPDCQNVQVSIEPVADICLTASSIPVQLTAQVSGNQFNGTYTWSGPGIIDQSTGLFDPTVAGASPSHTVQVIYEENDCQYPSDIQIAVYDAPVADFDLPSEICAGSEFEVTFTGSAELNANFQYDFNGADIISDNGNGNYTIRVDDPGLFSISLQVIQNGCPSNNINRSILIAAPIEAPIINCSNDYTNLEFSWNTIPNVLGYGVVINGGSSIVVSDTVFPVQNLIPNQSVDISVTALSANACPNVTSISSCTTLDCPDLQFALLSPQEICRSGNGTIALDVQISGNLSTGTITWSGPGVSGNEFDPSSLAPGDYLIQVQYEELGCISTENFTIEVLELPNISALSDTPVSCYLDEVTLSAVSNANSPTLQWSGPGIVSGDQTNTPVVNAPGIYQLDITDGVTGCQNSTTVEVLFDDTLPVVFATGTAKLTCSDPTTQLIAVGDIDNAFEITWVGPGITALNEHEINPTVDQPGWYSVQVTRLTQNQCTSLLDSIFVEDNTQAPEALIIQPLNDQLDCYTLSLILTGEGKMDNSTYMWTDASGNMLGEDMEITVQAGGIYTFMVLDTINGCMGMDSIEIVDNTTYPFSEAGPEQTIDCTQSIATLNGTGTQLGADVLYNWSGPNGFELSQTTDLIIEVTEPGWYFLMAVDTILGCETMDSVLVNYFNNGPVAIIDPVDLIGCNDNTSLVSAASSLRTDVFEWRDDNGQIISQSAQWNAPEGNYVLLVTNAATGCQDTASVQVLSDPAIPTGLSVEQADPICFGQNNGWLEVVEVFGGTPPLLYSINNGPFTPATQFQNLPAGEYLITMEDALGCQFEETYFLEEQPEISFNIGDLLVLELGDTTSQIIPSISLPWSEIDTILWSPMEYLECPDGFGLCQEPIIKTVDPVLVEATLITLDGCEARASLQVRVNKEKEIFVPNVFSPNGDGINERFEIFGKNDLDQILQVHIYDRWGEQVFNVQNINVGDFSNSWDGTFRGEDAPVGVYVYVIEVAFKDGTTKIFQGDLTLMR